MRFLLFGRSCGRGTVSSYVGEMAELVEGAPLLREYGVKSSIEGSNPSLSAIFISAFLTLQRINRIIRILYSITRP